MHTGIEYCTLSEKLSILVKKECGQYDFPITSKLIFPNNARLGVMQCFYGISWHDESQNTQKTT